MATTPNYGWVTPAPTDFVTDLPADFETFADAVDASFAADEGDILIGNSSDIFVPLAIGSNGTILTSNGTTATWAAAPASGAYTQLATGSLTGASVSITSIAGTYRDLVLVLTDFYASSAGTVFYTVNSTNNIYATGMAAGGFSGAGLTMGTSSFYANASIGSLSQTNSEIMSITNYASSVWKMAQTNSVVKKDATDYAVLQRIHGIRLASAVTSIQITPESGTWSAGTYTLYGVK